MSDLNTTSLNLAPLNLDSHEAKASYGVGLQMGQQLTQMFDGVSLEAAIAGIQDAYADKTPRLTGAEINAAFQYIQQQMQGQQAESAKKFAGEGEAFLALNAQREGVVVLESGLQYEVIEAGSGATPGRNDVVRTHYRGTLINGQQFDSSYDRGEPAEFPVKGVIAGWTEALQKMQVGAKWKLYIPYHLAYGEQGAGGAIGPYQALIFDIELMDIVA